MNNSWSNISVDSISNSDLFVLFFVLFFSFLFVFCFVYLFLFGGWRGRAVYTCAIKVYLSLKGVP